MTDLGEEDPIHAVKVLEEELLKFVFCHSVLSKFRNKKLTVILISGLSSVCVFLLFELPFSLSTSR